MFRKVLFGLIVALMLVSCAKATTPPTSTSTTRPPTPSIIPSTATSVPPTAVPPTATAAPSATPTAAMPTATLPPLDIGPQGFAAGVNPLTGLSVANPILLERRPVAVKVNIVPRSLTRPAWGLSFADIVYDYYHNDGYSRLHAIFYGNDAELVGPIRSGRLLDSDLIRMYQSIFAYGSADATINNRLLNAEYSDRLILEGNISLCPPTASNPLCRYDPAGSDHLLGSTAALSQYISAQGVNNSRPNLDGMTFNVTPPQGGSSAAQVFVRYSSDNYARWDYDASSGLYLRFQDNAYDQGQGETYAPLLDRLNNQQITAANVVVIYVPHVYFMPPPNEIVEILLSGSGKAYAFRDGQAYEVTWNRTVVNSVLFLTFPDGSRYPFKPGNTWIEVVSDPSTLSKPGEDIWRFVFAIP